jgi:hypothetical protein
MQQVFLRMEMSAMQSLLQLAKVLQVWLQKPIQYSLQ